MGNERKREYFIEQLPSPPHRKKPEHECFASMPVFAHVDIEDVVMTAYFFIRIGIADNL